MPIASAHYHPLDFTAMTIDLRNIIKAYDVRGLSPEELSPEVAHAVGAAFARVVVIPEFSPESDDAAGSNVAGSGLNDAAGLTDAANLTDAAPRPKVVIGRDMRETGPVLVAAFAQGLTEAGVDVELIGLCSTDGLYYAAASRGIPGAMFTASHNPAAYNGIKMCRAAARPVGQQTGLAEIRDLAQAYLDSGMPQPNSATELGEITAIDDLPNYAKFLRSLVDLSHIRPLKVVIDAGNGMGGLTAPAVLGEAAGLPALPLELIPLYWELDGTFPNHEANPLEPKNIVDLQKAVVAHGADLGLAFDGDADRCFVVDEKGEPVSSSVITLLVGLRELARAQQGSNNEQGANDDGERPPAPTIVYNCISSRAVPEILAVHGAITSQSRVGHSFIKAQMAENNAVFGGEHSGHFYFRDFWFADSGMLAALHVLAALGASDLPLSAINEMYQPYTQSGEINSRVPDVAAVRDAIIAEYQAAYPDAKVENIDGITFSNWEQSPKWWFNLRGSNTEPLLRLNVEAQDEDVMEKVRDDVLNLIKTHGGTPLN